MKRNQEHYRGCLIGGAIGDAFGSAVEFLSIGAIREKYGKTGVLKESTVKLKVNLTVSRGLYSV